LLVSRHALVVTIWEPLASLGSFAWAGAITGGINLVALDRAAAENGGDVAREGLRIAQAAGMEGEPLAKKSRRACLEGDRRDRRGRDVAAIVIGSRGLTTVTRVLLGSVSTAVLASRRSAHARHPRPSDDEAD
jgi:nucleotide-binding universal stress UspA family protein